MLDTPCSEVEWRVLATHSIRQFPLHCPSRASPCAITFQLESVTALDFCLWGSNAGYTVFRGSVKSTGYPLHSPVSPSLSLPCVTVCHHISTRVCNCFRFLFVWLNAERSLEKNCCLAFCMLLCAWRKVKTNSGEELTIFARELQSGLSLALGYSNICCLKLKVIYFSLLPFTVLRCVIPFVCLNYKMR